MDTRSIVLSSISKKRNSKNKSHQEYYFIDRTFAKSKNSVSQKLSKSDR
ncbi:hypothetical protein LEP1GSC168_1434 [Leptospira santarosai str. HAI134]|nr:hypothetical protein LEP1GSC168_1434 [Leptospira santarosai str. HAI134]